MFTESMIYIDSLNEAFEQHVVEYPLILLINWIITYQIVIILLID